MCKLIFLVTSLLITSMAMAEGPQVKITSFSYSAPSTSTIHLAELCGIVRDMTSSPTFVHVVVDQSSKNPASYNTVTGTDGKFCMTVTTYYGTAEATILH
ncbi:MAG: hypothetical protein H7281_06635 [Bacteriovorax sp.]|nr:hypothetical protein [Bacteriovorax sp.]